MSTSYYECDACGYGFSEISDYARWCGCGAHFCSAECADIQFEDASQYDDDVEPDDCDREDRNCAICRHEIATDEGLLKALLKHFGIDREKAMEIYRQQMAPATVGQPL